MKTKNTQPETIPQLDDLQLQILDSARHALEDCWRKQKVMPLMVIPLEDENGDAPDASENSTAAIVANRAAIVETLQFSYAPRTREHASLVLMNNHGRLIGVYELSKGENTHCPISFRDVAGLCWQHGASYAVACHNHPAGNPSPSDGDISVTQQLGDFLQRMNVLLLDHVVVATSGCASVRFAIETQRNTKPLPDAVAPLLWVLQ